VNSALPSSLLLLLFFLPFTWGRHCPAPATTALPGTTSLDLLILFGATQSQAVTASDENCEQQSAAAAAAVKVAAAAAAAAAG
jgi:hypothetical protein